MKLTGKLKTQVDNAPTKEEKRDAIKKAGMLLTDDELDQVSGGYGVYSNTCLYHPGCPNFERSKCLGVSCPWAQG